MISLQYRGRVFELSMTDRACAVDVWGLSPNALLGYRKDTSVTDIDHPYSQWVVRLGRWTAVLEVTGVNPRWYSDDSIARRAQRARDRVAKFYSRGPAM